MKKRIAAVIVFGCLMIISLTSLALSHMQVTKSMKIQNEKNADLDTQLPDSQVATQDAHTFESASPQTSKSDNQQASNPEAAENSDKVDSSCKDETTLSKNESSGNSVTDQSQDDGTSTPSPDGRIFLDGEPPYPYIPTYTPKGLRTPPIPLGPED